MLGFSSVAINIIRWTARVVGFLASGFFMMFFIGEGIASILLGDGGQLFFFFLVTAVAGYILGWFFETAGGVLMIFGGASMAIDLAVLGGMSNFNMILAYGLPFTAVGILYCLCRGRFHEYNEKEE